MESKKDKIRRHVKFMTQDKEDLDELEFYLKKSDDNVLDKVIKILEKRHKKLMSKHKKHSHDFQPLI
jgi:hypothetical protein